MNLASRSRAPRGLALIAVGIALAACSPGAASVAPSTTAVVTAAPTVAATPTPAATVAATASASEVAVASGSAQPDPAIDLKIGAPYKLTALDPALEAVFKTQFTQGAGAFGNLVGVGGRTVTKDSKLVGYVFVVGFPAGLMTATAYQAMLTGMQSSMGATFSTQTISGVDVAVGTTATGTIGVLQSGDHVVLTLTPTGAELPAVAKAIIDANK